MADASKPQAMSKISTGAPARTTRRKRGFSPATYLPYYLAHVLHRYDLNMAAELSRSGLNNSSWRVLSTLHYRSRLSLTELSRITVLERSFVGRVVGGLRERGLVLREAGEFDRRNVRVSLTREGMALFRDAVWPIVSEQIDIAMRGVTAAEEQQLLALLERVMENVYRAAHETLPEPD